MPISRRFFLRAGTLVALGAAAQSKLARVVVGKTTGGGTNAVSGFLVPAASMDDPLTYYTKSTFEAYLNSKFKLRQGDGSSSTVTLIKVVDGAPAPSTDAVQVGNSECFTLVFSLGKRLPQATYTVDHAALGTFKLLLVPSGMPGATPQLDAVINRLYS